jgi:hypothetical protein
LNHTSSDPVMPLMLNDILVLALKTVVWVSLGLLPGVQNGGPSRHFIAVQ